MTHQQQDQQLAMLSVTLPSGESITPEIVALSKRDGEQGRDRVYFVLSRPTSAIVAGKPFHLEWGGGQKPDIGRKSDIPWDNALRLQQEGEQQEQQAPPKKAHKVIAWANRVKLIYIGMVCTRSAGTGTLPIQKSEKPALDAVVYAGSRRSGVPVKAVKAMPAWCWHRRPKQRTEHGESLSYIHIYCRVCYAVKHKDSCLLAIPILLL